MSSGGRGQRVSAVVDRVAAGVIRAGGLGVILALLLIILYLLFQVAPLFRSAAVDPLVEYALPAADRGPSVYLAAGDGADGGLRVTASGGVVVFSGRDGAVRRLLSLDLPARAAIERVVADSSRPGRLAAGLSDGSAIVFEVPDGGAEEAITYPLGPAPFPLLDGAPLRALGIDSGDDGVLLVGAGGGAVAAALVADAPRRMQLLSWDAPPPAAVSGVVVVPGGQRLMLLDADGALHPVARSGRRLAPLPGGPGGRAVTAMALLPGGRSLVTAWASGGATQWQLPGGEAAALKAVRTFDSGPQPLLLLAAEQHRQGFAAIDAGGALWLVNATSQHLWQQRALAAATPLHLALAADAGRLLLEFGDGRMAWWRVANAHPEVSWRSLWGRVAYEDDAQARFSWQPAASGDGFEPKMSLVPLVFGTLKAAFVALLLALPLGVGGAIYTAHFMDPGVRRYVKPMVELMEALPTVILGFVAALWLAPLLEANLLGALLAALLWPLAVLGAAAAWHALPPALSQRLPTGLQGVLVVPVLAAFFAGCFRCAPLLESTWFGGDFTLWLSRDLGVAFQQRNALVVGVALGFAIVPSIFSIAEDALFSVPPHLTQGALALGARPWQTLVGVVLPIASPAILSAAMIGCGRALGETMIVLMASGNTPLLDVNLFEGLRSVAASVAMEVPEAELGGTHYRVLFLSGLVLLGFTLLCNTPAELLRQRMRRRYRSL